MTLGTWLAFVCASILLLALPGPTALMIVRASDTKRISAIAATVFAALLGDMVAMTFCNVGLGALISASSQTLVYGRYFAALYLIVIGIKSFVGRRAGRTKPAPPRQPTKARDVFLVTALNPKGIVFFAAFLPQFVRGTSDVVLQLALLQATFAVLSAMAALAWVAVGLGLRKSAHWVSSGRRTERGIGVVMIGAGLSEAIWG